MSTTVEELPTNTNQTVNQWLRRIEYPTRRPGTDERQETEFVHNLISQVLNYWQENSINVSFDNQVRFLQSAQRWDFPVAGLSTWLSSSDFVNKAIEKLQSNANSVDLYARLGRLAPYLQSSALNTVLEDRENNQASQTMRKIRLIEDDLVELRAKARRITGFATENKTRVENLDKALFQVQVRVDNLLETLKPVSEQPSNVRRALQQMGASLEQTQTHVYAAQQRYNYVDRFKPANQKPFPTAPNRPFVPSYPVYPADVASNESQTTPVIIVQQPANDKQDDDKVTVDTATWPTWLIAIVVIAVLVVIGTLIAIVALLARRNSWTVSNETYGQRDRLY